MLTNSCLRAVTVIGMATAIVAAGSAVAGAAPNHSRPSIAVHTTKHHRVVGPNKTAPGVVRLRNTGKHPIVVLTSHGHSVSTLIADENAGRASKFLKHFTIRDIIDAHTDAYLRLGHGRYYLVDSNVQTKSAAQVHTLTVSGRTRNAALPASTGIRIDSHRALHAPQRLSSHRYLRVDNDSAATQALVLLAIGRNTTDAQLAAFAAKPSIDKLIKLDVRRGYLGALLGAHHAAWVNPHLRAGRYVMYTQSFNGPRNSGQFHRYQVRVLTVS